MHLHHLGKHRHTHTHSHFVHTVLCGRFITHFESRLFFSGGKDFFWGGGDVMRWQGCFTVKA